MSVHLVKLAFLLLSLSICWQTSCSAEWRWTGKIAVVTGASSGIGAQIALDLADKGMIVVGLARRNEKIEELAKRTNGKLYGVKCDLTREEDIIKAFRYIEVTFGGVDVLINNAGIYKISSLVYGDFKDWKSVIDVNVLGLSIASKEALRTMRARGDDGHIININSVSGHTVPTTEFPSGLYSASKYAVTSITESLRLELRSLKSKVRMTSISPGLVKTEIITNATAENPEILDNRNTKDYLELPSVTPNDIAEGVIYVLSTRPIVQIQELTIQAIGHTMCF